MGLRPLILPSCLIAGDSIARWKSRASQSRQRLSRGVRMNQRIVRVSAGLAGLAMWTAATAQGTLTNPGLKATGMPWSQYEAIAKGHAIECQVHARNLGAQAAAQQPPLPRGYLGGHIASQREREQRELIQTAFNGCMAQKGWIITPARQ